jgi:hypothetical protein
MELASKTRVVTAERKNLWRAFAMLSTVLIVLLVLMLVGALPSWGYSRSWGYGPGGLVGVILLIIVILALTGHV